jgi:hypothetical protein
MERFVFIAAITVAIIFGVSAVFGGPHWNFHIDLDDEGGGKSYPVVELTSGSLAAQAYAGDRIRVRGAAANVVVIPEDRADFEIAIDNSAGRAPMPEISTEDGRITIDGRLRGRVSDCGTTSVSLRGYGDVAVADLPRITIRAPRTINMERGGAGSTEIGASEAVDLDFSGCGNATIGDVAGDLVIDLAGSGEVRAGAARSLNADVAGSGDITTGAIAEGANIDIAGSGTVTVGSLTGSLAADGAGSGNVSVQAGAITTADVDLAGSGDVDIVASVQSLNVSIVGSGDVSVEGAVGDIDAEIAGSGGVSATSVTGSVRKEVWGSGDVQVGR